MHSLSASRARKWHVVATADLRKPPTRRQIEAEFWEELSLALIFPRFVPEWIDDATISETLWRTIANERLPWEIDDETFEAMSHDPIDD